jgi:hypothetical protein
MKKLILPAIILLATISVVEAQSELGEAYNNPIFNNAVVPLIPCEESIIRDNLFLPRYDEKRMRDLIRFNCAPQIKAVIEACEMLSDNNNDDCQTVIDKMLSRHYTAIVNNITRK